METGIVLAGRYQLMERLGRGGMGEVWRATDSKIFGRDVAVKIIRANDVGEEAVQRFAREASIAARISHPCITVVHDYGADQGQMFIVMELVRGEDLAKAIARNRGGLPADEVIGYGIQIADGLDAAHAEGVVHRDLKPSNIIVTPAGRVKICDFGIARDEMSPQITQAGMVFGTPAYMSPEQWTGEQVTAMTDLYALGVILCELLTGAPPFAAPGVAALMNQHLTKPPVGPANSVAGVPAALNDLVLALLAKDPAGRPASAAEVLSALTEIQRGELTGPQFSPGPGYNATVAVSLPSAQTGDQAARAAQQSGPPSAGRVSVPPPVPTGERVVRSPQQSQPPGTGRTDVPAGAPIVAATLPNGRPEVFVLQGSRVRGFAASQGGAPGWIDLSFLNGSGPVTTGSRGLVTAITGAGESSGRGDTALFAVSGATGYGLTDDGGLAALPWPKRAARPGTRVTDVAVACASDLHAAYIVTADADGEVLAWTGRIGAARWRQVSVSIDKVGPAAAIAACSYLGETPAIFALVGGRVIYCEFGLLGRSTWRGMGEPETPVVDVACWSLALGNVQVFALDADGYIWTTASADRMSTWSPWQSIAAPSAQVRALAATASYGSDKYAPTGSSMLLAINADGLLYQAYQPSAAPQSPDWPTWSPLPPL